jgi:adenine-specific DNA-methyltransferase
MSLERLEFVRSVLGEPYRVGCLVYNVDCVEAMRALTDAREKDAAGIFDLTVTSPPYNIGKEYERVMPLEAYLGWSARWISLVHGLTADDGTMWLNLGYAAVPSKGRAVPIPYLLYDRVPFFLVQEVVWHYGAGVACKRQFSPRNEKFLWYVKDETRYTFNLDDVRDPNVKYPNQRRNGVLRCNPLGKNPSDVWTIPKVTSGRGRASRERTAHPAQFPIAVIERIVRASSRAGDLVLDPFMGSGTTAEVALREGRTVVGFEIDKGYCDVIARRLDGLDLPVDDDAHEVDRCHGADGAARDRSDRKRKRSAEKPNAAPSDAHSSP